MNKIWKAILQWNKRLEEDAVPAFSAQAAFFIVISLFPLFMLLATSLQYLPWNQEQMMGFFFSILPDTVRELAQGVLTEIYTNDTGIVLSVTAITALWSASKGMYALLQGLRAVYHRAEEPEVKNWHVRALAVVYTILLIFILLFVMGLWVFGSGLQNLLLEKIPALNRVAFLLRFLRLFVGFCIMVIFCMLLYTAARPRNHYFYRYFPGALLSSLGWMGFSYAYSFYIGNFSKVSYFYGSLTAVVFLMLWLYFCMYILLAGAELNEWICENKY